MASPRPGTNSNSIIANLVYAITTQWSRGATGYPLWIPRLEKTNQIRAFQEQIKNLYKSCAKKLKSWTPEPRNNKNHKDQSRSRAGGRFSSVILLIKKNRRYVFSGSVRPSSIPKTSFISEKSRIYLCSNVRRAAPYWPPRMRTGVPHVRQP